jgi:hypothetical protein
VNKGVKEDEKPDGWCHVADSCPHAHHGTSVVVCLQSAGSLSLSQNDNSIQNLVELGKIEEPSVESQSLVPESSAISWSWLEAGRQGNCWGLSNPLRAGWVVGDGIAESSLAVRLAEGVDNSNNAALNAGTESSLHAAEHAVESPRRVNGQEDVMRDNECLEGTGLGDCPWLVSAGLVEAVDGNDGDGVDGSDGDWDPGVEELDVEIGWDGEWWRENSISSWWCGDGDGVSGGRELEEGVVWAAKFEGRHCDNWQLLMMETKLCRRDNGKTIESQCHKYYKVKALEVQNPRFCSRVLSGKVWTLWRVKGKLLTNKSRKMEDIRIFERRSKTMLWLTLACLSAG